MRIPYYQVNAFSCGPFSGNPAGVCPLKDWLPDTQLQRIATENNLSETAFFKPTARPGDYDLRWMTPAQEIDLCGHATLATAHVLFSELGLTSEAVHFNTLSGMLAANRLGDLVELDFPSRPPVPCDITDSLIRAIGGRPVEALKSRDYVVVFPTEQDVLALKPDIALVAKLDCLGLIVTAPGTTCDFVSRFFAPRAGVDEDPVTGSAHCSLIPYWSKRLGKKNLKARQVSKRGGELICRDSGERVGIAGKIEVYLRGELQVPE